VRQAGTWTGKRTEYFNGRAITGAQVLTIRKLGNGGFSAKSTMSFPGIGVITASGKYIVGGDYEASTFFRGQAIANASGTWYIKGNTIRVKFQVQDISGFSRGTAQWRFVNSRTMTLVSSQSNGGRVSITLRRR
jgi:hypothetical protein